jgi:PhnB protein
MLQRLIPGWLAFCTGLTPARSPLSPAPTCALIVQSSPPEATEDPIMSDTPVHYIPKGYSSVTPYLIVKGATQAIDFYKKIFGATEVMRMTGPDGRIGHAELSIGGSHIMLADEQPEMGHQGPLTLGNSPVSVLLYVEDVDSIVDRAVADGATILKPVADQFYGDRMGFIRDPFGHRWAIATHKEDLSEDEMKKRAKQGSQAA